VPITKVERLEGNNVKLTVTASAEDVDKAITEAYARLGAKLRVPGFRKGKAPRPVVDNFVGREHVLAEATEELVNSQYPLAIDAESLRPIESPEMDGLDTVEAGKEYTFVAQIELRPELTLSGSEPVAIEMPPHDVAESEIQLHLDNMRDRFATLKPVEGRGVAANDFVLLSFTGYVDGETYDGNQVDKYLYEMNHGLMPKEFDDGILGIEAGGETTVEFDIPDTSSNPDFVGKKARFDVVVHEIKEKSLPELNDEFATLMGGFDTVEDMRKDLVDRLQVQKSMTYDRDKERMVRIELAKRLKGDVPESMITARANSMMRDFHEMLESREITLESYMEMLGVDFATIQSDITAQAASSVHEDLALEALFRARKMEVTDADVDEEVASVADATESTPEESRKRWEQLGLMPVLREQIMHRKAVLWLMETAEVTEVEPAGEGEKPAEGTKKTAKKKAAPKAKKAAAETDQTSEE
jgi:trigger factor